MNKILKFVKNSIIICIIVTFFVAIGVYIGNERSVVIWSIPLGLFSLWISAIAWAFCSLHLLIIADKNKRYYGIMPAVLNIVPIILVPLFIYDGYVNEFHNAILIWGLITVAHIAKVPFFWPEVKNQFHS